MQNYEYICTLGEGAYGAVWQCKEKGTGRLVAVKGFKGAHDDKEVMAVALREIKHLAMVSHPNVVEFISAFRSRTGRVYMVLEHMDSSIGQLLDRHPGGLPAYVIKVIAWQLLHALSHLHERKMIHRDIKPANILLNPVGVAKLCDFGFARLTRCGPTEVAQMSSYVVTRWYRAPEVLVGELYGPSADVWSLGCTIAEMVTGQPLLPGATTADQLWRLMRCFGQLPPRQDARIRYDSRLPYVPLPQRGRTLQERLPGAEAQLLHVIEACLQPDPTRRPTARQLLAFPFFFDVACLVHGTPLAALYVPAAPAARPSGTGGAQSAAAAAAPAGAPAGTPPCAQPHEAPCAAATAQPPPGPQAAAAPAAAAPVPPPTSAAAADLASGPATSKQREAELGPAALLPAAPLPPVPRPPRRTQPRAVSLPDTAATPTPPENEQLLKVPSTREADGSAAASAAAVAAAAAVVSAPAVVGARVAPADKRDATGEAGSTAAGNAHVAACRAPSAYHPVVLPPEGAQRVSAADRTASGLVASSRVLSPSACCTEGSALWQSFSTASALALVCCDGSGSNPLGDRALDVFAQLQQGLQQGHKPGQKQAQKEQPAALPALISSSGSIGATGVAAIVIEEPGIAATGIAAADAAAAGAAPGAREAAAQAVDAPGAATPTGAAAAHGGSAGHPQLPSSVLLGGFGWRFAAGASAGTPAGHCPEAAPALPRRPTSQQGMTGAAVSAVKPDMLAVAQWMGSGRDAPPAPPPAAQPELQTAAPAAAAPAPSAPAPAPLPGAPAAAEGAAAAPAPPAPRDISRPSPRSATHSVPRAEGGHGDDDARGGGDDDPLLDTSSLLLTTALSSKLDSDVYGCLGAGLTIRTQPCDASRPGSAAHANGSFLPPHRRGSSAGSSLGPLGPLIEAATPLGAPAMARCVNPGLAVGSKRGACGSSGLAGPVCAPGGGGGGPPAVHGSRRSLAEVQSMPDLPVLWEDNEEGKRLSRDAPRPTLVLSASNALSSTPLGGAVGEEAEEGAGAEPAGAGAGAGARTSAGASWRGAARCLSAAARAPAPLPPRRRLVLGDTVRSGLRSTAQRLKRLMTSSSSAASGAGSVTGGGSVNGCAGGEAGGNRSSATSLRGGDTPLAGGTPSTTAAAAAELRGLSPALWVGAGAAPRRPGSRTLWRRLSSGVAAPRWLHFPGAARHGHGASATGVPADGGTPQHPLSAGDTPRFGLGGAEVSSPGVLQTPASLEVCTPLTATALAGRRSSSCVDTGEQPLGRGGASLETSLFSPLASGSRSNSRDSGSSGLGTNPAGSLPSDGDAAAADVGCSTGSSAGGCGAPAAEAAGGSAAPPVLPCAAVAGQRDGGSKKGGRSSSRSSGALKKLWAAWLDKL